MVEDVCFSLCKCQELTSLAKNLNFGQMTGSNFKQRALKHFLLHKSAFFEVLKCLRRENFFDIFQNLMFEIRNAKILDACDKNC